MLKGSSGGCERGEREGREEREEREEREKRGGELEGTKRTKKKYQREF